MEEQPSTIGRYILIAQCFTYSRRDGLSHQPPPARHIRGILELHITARDGLSYARLFIGPRHYGRDRGIGQPGGQDERGRWF